MSIENKYKKLTDIEHILNRSGMYVGSIKMSNADKFVLLDGKISKSKVVYNPAFLKIFDEIVINSVDENKRVGSKLNTIKVNIDGDKISVWDNGGIEVVMHKEYKEWIPEMVFSNLKAGSNFSDDEERTTGGLNGVGSTLTNVFSKEFNVSTCDGKNLFLQTFSENMKNKIKPIVKPSKKNHTLISFIPDYEKFNMTGLDSDHLKMLHKRVIDLAGCNPGIKFYFNDELIQIKSFEDYIKYYTDDYIISDDKNERWQLGIAPSEFGFTQVSFVNSCETYDGGTHIDYILNQIVSKLREFFLKKHKVDVKPSDLKNHMFIFLNTTVVNPSFSSQTKEKLITEPKDFGSQYEVSDKFIKKIIGSEIVQLVLDWVQQKKAADESKLARDLNKSLSKLKVDKLIDCSSTDRSKCELFIMEGLSALGDFRRYREPKTQAAYTLKGKFMNINGMSKINILKNEEASGLIKSMGLNILDSSDISRLRYGKIIICTDMDTDGDSICALLLNFFNIWPDLFKNKRIYRALTPLLVLKSRTKKKENLYFYTNDEFKTFSEKNDLGQYEIDYKKGLGSLETLEFKQLIENTKLINFEPNENYSSDLELWFGDESSVRKNKLIINE
jgi:DNA topoisomerase-2